MATASSPPSLTNQPAQPPSSSGSTPQAQPQTQPQQAPPEQQQQQQTKPSQRPLPRFLENDPARTGYDPSLKWWMTYFKVLTGQVTQEGIEHWREDRYRANEARDCARCEADRDYLFRYSPLIRFLRDKVAALNGSLDASNVVCRRCPARVDEDGRVVRQAGGFSPDHGILICANVMRDRGHLEDTLAHEMVHAWDHLRWKVNWSGEGDLRHAACTEIRASMLSGECRWTREAFLRGNWTLTQQFQNCVRTRAILSVMARPACRDEAHAAKVVNQVWDSCFADTRPFDEVYR